MSGKLDDILKSLSYPMRQKTLRLLETRDKISNRQKELMVSLLVTGIAAVLVISNIASYLGNVISPAIFGHTVKRLSLFELIVLVVATIGGTYCYLKYKELGEENQRFEKLRQNLKDAVGKQFCTCSIKCKCIDDYARVMEAEGIDLIL